MLTLNLVRRLADEGLTPGSIHQWHIFDPATLRNAPVTVKVGEREIVRSASTPIPAFRVDMEFSGLKTTAWITDTGEIVREESPLDSSSCASRRSGRGRLRWTAESGRTCSRCPPSSLSIEGRKPPLPPIDDPRNVRRLRMRVEGADLSSPDLQGAGQRIDGNIVEIIDAQKLGPARRRRSRSVPGAEPFIESDDPDIRAAAEEAVGRAVGTRARAEALTRFVNRRSRKSRPSACPPRAKCCARVSATATSTRRCSSPCRGRPGYRRGLLSASFTFAARSLPRVAGGLHRRKHGARILAAGRPYLQPVSCRRHAFPARARWPGQAGSDHSDDRTHQDHCDRCGGRAWSTPVLVGKQKPSPGRAERAPDVAVQSRWCLPCFLGGHR